MLLTRSSPAAMRVGPFLSLFAAREAMLHVNRLLEAALQSCWESQNHSGQAVSTGNRLEMDLNMI